MTNGFINLYKPAGITSNKALGVLKYSLKCNNILTKVGHMGTLDPDAEGVLPVALGRATRLFNYLLDKKKTYYAVFKFGILTDTLDLSGEITAERYIDITDEALSAAIASQVGTIAQIPPMYSAKSVNGKRAYALARQGKTIDLPPKNVEIYDISLQEKLGENSYAFRIVCGGGTYIRAIARDMGESMGTFGTMTYLKREKSGVFDENTAVMLDDVADNLLERILPMDYPLAEYPLMEICEQEQKLLLDGIQLDKENLPEGYFRVYNDKKIVGIGEALNGKLRMCTWLL